MEDRTRELAARSSAAPAATAQTTQDSSSAAGGLQGEVQEITKKLDVLRDNTAALDNATKSKRMDANSSQLVETTNALIFELKGKMIALSRGMNDSTNPEAAIRKSQHAKLTARFKELVDAYKTTQDAHKQTLIDLCTEQAKIVTPGITRDEVAAMVAEGKENSIFADKLLGAAHAKAKAEYKFITGWYEDLLRLERSITELLQLFIDVSTLVETQGQTLEEIVTTVDEANEQASQAVQHLQKANEAAGKKRKRRAICCCCVGTATAAAAGGAGAAAYLNGCSIS